MKKILLIGLLVLNSYAMDKKEYKSCVKEFKKFEKKRDDKSKTKLTELKCLESEEFQLELNRIEAKSPSGDFFSSKFQYKKKKLQARFDEHFESIKALANSFEKLRSIDAKKTWLRQSSCKFAIAQVEKNTSGLKDEWEVTVQITDDTIHALSQVSFKDKVLLNENFKDSHFERIMDKIQKKSKETFIQCVLRDVF